MQTAMVIISIIMALAYAAYRIRRAIRHSNNPCDGCQGCSLKQGNMAISECEKKKYKKKFG